MTIKMFEWIKKHKISFVLICISVFIFLVGVPFIINLLFKFNSNISVLEAEWSAGDALGYYGAVLSFVGTVVLGALALYQNHIIKTDADKKAKLLEAQEKAENMPRFFMRLHGASGFCGKLQIAIMNVSNNIAYDINIYNIKLEQGSNTIWEYKDTYGSPAINPQKHIEIQTQTPSQTDKDDVVFSAVMTCLDKYNDKHEYILKMICHYPNNYEETSVTETLH